MTDEHEWEPNLEADPAYEDMLDAMLQPDQPGYYFSQYDDDLMQQRTEELREHMAAEEVAYRRYLDALAAYEAQWPDYCRTCGGTGSVSWTENASPHGSGEFWGMTVEDLCSCQENGYCPRCGEAIFDPNIEDEITEDTTCPNCNWNGKAPGAPRW